MIHALLSEEHEELNIEKAEAAYREVQKHINRGELYELYGDVERLIPEHLKPECIEKVVEIQEYVRDKASPRKKATAALGIKRKRNDDVMRNIPDSASTGFVSVRDLIVKNASKTKMKKVKMSKDFDADGKDDDTDQDIESGRIMAPICRTQSAAAGPSTASSTKTKEREKLIKSSTIRPKESNPQSKKKVAPPTSKQFAKQGTDDPGDIDIEQGVISTRQSDRANPPQDSDEDERDLPRQKSPLKRSQSRTILSLSPEPSMEPLAAVVELTDSERGPLSPNSAHYPSPMRQSPAKRSLRRGDDMGWLVDDDEDNLRIDIVDSSPLGPKNRNLSLERAQMKNELIMISCPQLSNQSRNSSATSKTLVDDSIVEIVEQDSPFKSFKGKRSNSRHRLPRWKYLC